MKRPLAALLLLLPLLPVTPSWGTTARDLSQRIVIDGFTSGAGFPSDWEDDESVFVYYDSTLMVLEEPSDDSKWANNDILQIRVTWDADSLYLAADGKIWGNNMVMLVDAVPGRGIAEMKNLTSWKRNFVFDTLDVAHDNDFAPDLFGATWDGNPTPRLIMCPGGPQVTDLQVGVGPFSAASTFFQDEDGRAMELAIPWGEVFANDPESRDTVVTVGGVRDTLRWFPPGQRRLKVCCVVTAGWDGSGGPDSAPDNTRGHSSDGAALVYVDNFAEIALDLRDDTGLGHGGPDGIPDWGIAPSDRDETGIDGAKRFRFKYPVPIVGVRYGLSDLEFSKPAFSPDRGERIHFRFRITENPLKGYPVDLSANVFDMRGRFIKNLFVGDRRTAFASSNPPLDVWDGRDEEGRVVPAGVYILRLVIEPNLSRLTRAVVVVR